ncbi:squalene/phytoene synthase family protein [Flavobacteriales bacterium]|jgi:15-cis-phytoene synthase|nr:squalene/phytoene synthase family protein [Flavobacteriales bacterium]
MKQLFDEISVKSSKLVTNTYSTSFSLGIKFLDKSIRTPIYNIYGFVRFADEIVDSFQGYDKEYLLKKFRKDTIEAIEQKISLNPILNSFQETVNKYNIEWELIETFLESMKMDLDPITSSQKYYEKYILGSAEVVGLMCLHVFTEGNIEQYAKLAPSAKKLGSAFQKVNFLRDAQADFIDLGRTYFPGVDFNNFCDADKINIEMDIENDFEEALIGIKQLPPSSRGGVYLAYYYYLRLFRKIKNVSSENIISERIRIPNAQKVILMLQSFAKHQANLL